MIMKKVKPSRPDLIVRDHLDKMKPLPPEGKEVPWTAVWAKRVKDGDAVIVRPEPAVVPAPPAHKIEPRKPVEETPRVSFKKDEDEQK